MQMERSLAGHIATFLSHNYYNSYATCPYCPRDASEKQMVHFPSGLCLVSTYCSFAIKIKDTQKGVLLRDLLPWENIGIRAYVTEHKILFDGESAEPCLDAQWWHYGETHTMSNDETRRLWQELLNERPGIQFYVGLVIMILATILMVKDTIGLQHTHVHAHCHSHTHIHGEEESIHDHAYEGNDSEEHTHAHS